MTTHAFGRTVWQLTAAALAPSHERNAAAGLLRLGDFSGLLTAPAGATKLGLPGGGRLDRSWGRSFGSGTRKGAPAHVFDQRLFGPAPDSRFIPLQPGRNVSLTARYSN